MAKQRYRIAYRFSNWAFFCQRQIDRLYRYIAGHRGKWRIPIGLIIWLYKASAFVSAGIGYTVPFLLKRFLTPEDILEVNRLVYIFSEKESHHFASVEYTESGLRLQEKKLLSELGLESGRVLVLGCSAGRECVALARKGFDVTGVDSVEAFIDAARRYAAQHGLDISYQVQSVARLNFRVRSFDLIMFSIYSLIPDKSLRKRIMDDLARLLRPGGSMILTFLLFRGTSRVYWRLTRLFQAITPRFEEGDVMYGPALAHFFTWDDFLREMEDFDWSVAHTTEDSRYGRAVVKPVDRWIRGMNKR